VLSNRNISDGVQPGTMNGVFLDEGSLNIGDIDLSPILDTRLNWQIFSATCPDEVEGRLQNVQVVITNKVVLDKHILARTPDLRLICVAATGTNNVDLEAATGRGIGVCNVRDYASATVAEHVFALILMLAKNLRAYQQAVHSGAWQRSRHFCVLGEPITELRGKTLGIVGYGSIGRSVAAIAKAFGMNVLVAARPGGGTTPGRIALSDLLARVDILTLHCPLTENTRGLIGKGELNRMRKDAVLINTARGGIVDEAALVECLREGRLGGAGVDVVAVEPPPDDNPLVTFDSPRLIVTPHIAWASLEARQRLVNELALNVVSFLQGEARNRIV